MSESTKTPVRFHLPGLRYNYPLNMMWVSLLETHPEYFREGVEIGSFFGCFPIAQWNGGRLVPNDQCDAGYIENVIKSVNAKGIPIRYTFTNPLLTEKDLSDPFCNFCMDAANNGMNEVIIVSPILEQYLREKYPNFKYNSSICKIIKDVDQLNEEVDRPYQYVVLDVNLNNKWDYLDKVVHKEKLEVLVNNLCQPGCPRRSEHYKQISRAQRAILLNRDLPEGKKLPVESWHCEYGERNCIHTIKDYPTVVSPDDIWAKYVPNGINNFKIEGRTGSLFGILDTYCYYMIKPEYADFVRYQVLQNLHRVGVVRVSAPRPGQWP